MTTEICSLSVTTGVCDMQSRREGILDYDCIIAQLGGCSVEELTALLMEELPYRWLDAYLEMTTRQTSVVRIRRGTFEYIFDGYEILESSGVVAYVPEAESRLVAALGQSSPPVLASRDDYRLKGWVGHTEKTFGQEWDKGHFIAYSLGGVVDGFEMNVFVQRRMLNRGWSPEGKRFRAIEKHCFGR